MSDRYIATVTQEIPGRAELSTMYLSRRGKTYDRSRSAEGLREWQSTISGDTEMFDTQAEAESVAKVYADNATVMPLQQAYALGGHALHPSGKAVGRDGIGI